MVCESGGGTAEVAATDYSKGEREGSSNRKDNITTYNIRWVSKTSLTGSR